MTQPESDTPRWTVERACDAALRAVETSLQAEGAEAVHVFVTVHARDVPPGELDCATAGHGYDDAKDLFVELAGALSGVGKQIGVRVDIVPMAGPVGEG